MQVIYTHEEMPYSFSKSIFLAGPSLRPDQEGEMESWRKDAIKILKDKGYNGIVFIPENRSRKFEKDFSYDNQIEWEEKYLNIADCIVFYVPRDLSLDKNGKLKLPAFTTNVEFGMWVSSGKVVFGAPEDADKITYLKYYADKFKVPSGDTLTETLQLAMDMVNDGAERSDGEREVPLFIWNTNSFQSWYANLKEAGNRLDGAKLLYNFRPSNKEFVFLWILKVNVYVAAEDRNKTNEFVLARSDISSVLMYYIPEDAKQSILDYEVVIIKEFRAPASNEEGFVRELPGGSSHRPNVPANETAAEEVQEETGMVLDPKRFKISSQRQMASTLSSHKAHLFTVELTQDEIKWFKSQKDIVHGNVEDSERTFIEVHSVFDLINNEELSLDWANLGMILSELLY